MPKLKQNDNNYDMGNIIYFFGCACGAKGRPASIVQSKIGAIIYNTKRDSEKLKQQIKYLNQLGVPLTGYPPVVVENGGARISLLEKWTQQQ